MHGGDIVNINPAETHCTVGTHWSDPSNENSIVGTQCKNTMHCGDTLHCGDALQRHTRMTHCSLRTHCCGDTADTHYRDSMHCGDTFYGHATLWGHTIDTHCIVDTHWRHTLNCGNTLQQAAGGQREIIWPMGKERDGVRDTDSKKKKKNRFRKKYFHLCVKCELLTAVA